MNASLIGQPWRDIDRRTGWFRDAPPHLRHSVNWQKLRRQVRRRLRTLARRGA